MKTNDKFKMNLQLFAEPNNDSDSTSETAEASQSEATQERTFTQAELDEAIKNRLNRYKREEAKRIEEAKQAARTDAEKLAKMTEAQRFEHERETAAQAAKAREDAIAQREAEITRRELRATAIDTLSQKGLPRELEAILNYTDADSCSTSIDVVEKAWRKAVQDGVNERLKTSGVNLRAGGNTDAALLSQMRRAAGLKE